MTLNNNNLPMMHKKTSTAVVEHPMTEDDLTHPGLYRFKRNSIPCYTFPQTASNEPVNNNNNNKTSSSQVEWDLYPGLMRDIENEGTPEQVEKLHRMQQSM